ncbi:probable (S)-N-methylcoclaurine 3'-hydroxylase isozyme 2 isoform X2 [Cornus florida]|uniref:probable (S)-N-methylcoclaurine 3'-hydroxylase isozyme 2 isoform X2 n=1 Tax=Cornus florida TaxID=4283 RepID=UPI00289AAB19|nr:probable (S)-N-methylcoclaurine 3'-hydroxylase isozyme 2 isoform X2 [Cornus florida]
MMATRWATPTKMIRRSASPATTISAMMGLSLRNQNLKYSFIFLGMMNYTIPKNSQVLVNVWAIGRDLMIWEDPLNFKPERFLNSTLDFKGTDFEFLPFGAGRRIFPALPMAAKLVPLIVASLS